MVISGYLHMHTTSNPTCFDHTKNQEKYGLVTGNDILTPHIWYLTQSDVQDIVIGRKL